MAAETEFRREWTSGTNSGFVAYGQGTDIDGAFDDAALSDRFETGTSGLIPSCSDVDPAGPRQVADTTVHRHAAWRAALAGLPLISAGVLHCIPVAPLKAFKHRNVNVVITDPAFPGPVDQGGLWLYPALFEAAAAVALPDLQDGEEFVSGHSPRKPSVRYKAAAVAGAGPKEAHYIVVEAGGWAPLSAHRSASEARRAALALARDKTAGPLELEVRQAVSRHSGVPLFAISRHAVACRRPVRLLAAARKVPGRPLPVDGWLFYGRIGAPDVPGGLVEL